MLSTFHYAARISIFLQIDRICGVNLFVADKQTRNRRRCIDRRQRGWFSWYADDGCGWTRGMIGWFVGRHVNVAIGDLPRITDVDFGWLAKDCGGAAF